MIEFHEAWLFKAENDLGSAEVLIRQGNPFTDTAIYHTQQCAEKALKGFLAFHKAEIQKIHNLAELIVHCSVFDSTFKTLLSDADDLTPTGTKFRYPDDPAGINTLTQLCPTVEEVKAAIAIAKSILDFVKSKISEG